MNKKLIKSFTAILLLCGSLILSCYSPNPLYGKWSDNKGNIITFNPDLTFSATIIDNNLNKELYDGSYSVIENVMVFTKNSGSTSNTEWDIRGSILYLTWTTDKGENVNLTLYHTAK